MKSSQKEQKENNEHQDGTNDQRLSDIENSEVDEPLHLKQLIIDHDIDGERCLDFPDRLLSSLGE